ncbi:response regulator, partial [bacterium]
GLGLATVYGIVKKSGGGISVTSAPGAGTTFHIDLPEAQAGAAAAPESSGVLAEGGAECILLVEDDDSLRRANQRVLRERGYRVVSARDGSEALAALKDPGEHIDLLLTDVVMPVMGGYELAREAARVRPGLKTLFVSGYPERDAGGAGPRPDGELLPKPFAPDALVQKVREALDRPGPGRGP